MRWAIGECGLTFLHQTGKIIPKYSRAGNAIKSAGGLKLRTSYTRVVMYKNEPKGAGGGRGGELLSGR